MLVIPYTNLFENKLRDILDARGMTREILQDLPSYGLIALSGNEVVALGFIRNMEGSYAILDSYISNPSSSAELRDRALDIITRKLIKTAAWAGVTKLLAFSTEETIIIRAIKNGFQPVPWKCVLIDLGKV